MTVRQLRPLFSSWTQAAQQALFRRLQELGFELQQGGTDPDRPESYTTVILVAAQEKLVVTVRLADELSPTLEVGRTTAATVLAHIPPMRTLDTEEPQTDSCRQWWYVLYSRSPVYFYSTDYYRRDICAARCY
jgi:hypothetical protein